MLYTIMGGVGTLIGPLIGAAIMILFKDYISAWFENYMLIVGAITVLVVLVAPRGILGLLYGKKDESAEEEDSFDRR